MEHEVHADQSMREIMEALPGARRALFARYHLGGCSQCAFSDNETLNALCVRSGLDAREVLDHLLASDRHDQSMWITPQDAAMRRDEFLWLDVRTREEHEAIPMDHAAFATHELQQELFANPPEKPILLLDHTGQHVLDQVAWYRGHGLRETYALRGGIDGWSRDIDPAVRRYRLEVDN